MSRLPQPGSDVGQWGAILNDFLTQSLKSDGTLKDGSVTAATIAPGSVTKADVGLGSVDDTSDVDKPISAAAQIALNAKLTASSNLSDLTNATTARTNLGLGSAATMTPASLASNAAFSNVYAPIGTLLSQSSLPNPVVALETGESVTVTQADANTITGITYTPMRIGGVSSADVDMVNDPIFRYGGTTSLPADAASPTFYVRAGGVTGGAGQAARYVPIYRFCTDAPEFEFECRFVAATQKHRLYVDGKLCDYRNMTGSSAEFIKFSFASAKPRIIDIAVEDPSWHGIRIPSTYTIWKAPDFTRRLFVNGDSLTAGASGVTRIDVFCWDLARLLGCDEVWNAAVGGTGWVSDGTGTTRFGDRTAVDMVPNLRANDIVVMKGSRNDADTATITSTATDVLNTLSACRNVFVVGTITNLGQNARVAAAAVAANRPFIDLSLSITGTGRIGATNGSGNSDRYILNDNVHLSQVGHDYIGRRIYDGIKQFLPQY